MHVARAVTVGAILLILTNVQCLAACAVRDAAPAQTSCHHHGGKIQPCLHGHHFMTSRVHAAPPPAVADSPAGTDAACAFVPDLARSSGYSCWHSLPPPVRSDTVVLRI